MSAVKHFFRYLSLLISLLLLCCREAGAIDDIQIYTEDWPPLNYVEEGELKGPAVDIVNQIQVLLKTKQKITVMPFKRAYKKVLNDKNSILFSVTGLKEREPLFKWVGPVAVKKYVLFAKKDSSITLATFEEAAKYTIGVQNGGATEILIPQKDFPKVEKVTSPIQNLRKLLSGHLDLWCDTPSTMIEVSRKNHSKPSDLKEVFVVDKKYLYIAFNKETDSIIIESWQNAFNTLYKQGIVKKIFLKYGDLSIYPDDLSDLESN